MNILFYIPGLSQEWGGIKQYSLTFLRMIHNDHQNHYFIYHDVKDPEIIGSIKNIPVHTLVTTSEIKKTNNKIKLFFTRSFDFLLTFLRAKKKIKFNDNFSAYCKKNSIQVIHSPFQYIPLTNAGKLIATLHDVQELHFPEFFSAKARADRALAYLDVIRRADVIIVSYDHIKKDLVKYFQVPEKKITVILLQMDKLWVHKYLQSDPVDLPGNLKGKRYIFYPANTWEHKNHIALLDAIAILKNEENLVINLVCTGHLTDPHGAVVAKKTGELNLQEQVKFLGIVDEPLLFSLYKNAAGVVVPTLYEAGSFPLMESIFLNVPVICSNVTSLPETMGNEDFIFDPRDISSIKNKLKQLWLDEDFRKRSLANSIIQSQKLSETGALNKILRTYQSVVEG